jgi:hypothetical protein
MQIKFDKKYQKNPLEFLKELAKQEDHQDRIDSLFRSKVYGSVEKRNFYKAIKLYFKDSKNIETFKADLENRNKIFGKDEFSKDTLKLQDSMVKNSFSEKSINEFSRSYLTNTYISNDFEKVNEMNNKFFNNKKNLPNPQMNLTKQQQYPSKEVNKNGNGLNDFNTQLDKQFNEEVKKFNKFTLDPFKKEQEKDIEEVYKAFEGEIAQKEANHQNQQQNQQQEKANQKQGGQNQQQGGQNQQQGGQNQQQVVEQNQQQDQQNQKQGGQNQQQVVEQKQQQVVEQNQQQVVEQNQKQGGQMIKFNGQDPLKFLKELAKQEKGWERIDDLFSKPERAHEKKIFCDSIALYFKDQKNIDTFEAELKDPDKVFAQNNLQDVGKDGFYNQTLKRQQNMQQNFTEQSIAKFSKSYLLETAIINSLKEEALNADKMKNLKELLQEPSYPKIDLIIKYLTKFPLTENISEEKTLKLQLNNIDNLLRDYDPLSKVQKEIKENSTLDKSTKDQINGLIISKLYQADTDNALNKVKSDMYDTQKITSQSETDRLKTDFEIICDNTNKPIKQGFANLSDAQKKQFEDQVNSAYKALGVEKIEGKKTAAEIYLSQ